MKQLEARDIDRAKIKPSPLNPRKEFRRNALDELTASIKANGILQNIGVRECEDGMHEIVYGERRFVASEAAGLTVLPCRVLECTDEELVELAMVENEDRDPLNPIEKARGYKTLIDLGRRQADLGKQGTVGNYIRLLELPESTQALVADLTLSVGLAKELLRWKTEPKFVEALGEIVVELGIKVAELEKPGFTQRADIVEALVKRGIGDVPEVKRREPKEPAAAVATTTKSEPIVAAPPAETSTPPAAPPTVRVQEQDALPDRCKPNTSPPSIYGSSFDTDAQRKQAEKSTEALTTPNSAAVMPPPATPLPSDTVLVVAALVAQLGGRAVLRPLDLMTVSRQINRVDLPDGSVEMTIDGDWSANYVALENARAILANDPDGRQTLYVNLLRYWSEDSLRSFAEMILARGPSDEWISHRIFEFAAVLLPEDLPASYRQAIEKTVKWLSGRVQPSVMTNGEVVTEYSSRNDDTPMSVENVVAAVVEMVEDETTSPGEEIKVGRDWIDQLAASNSGSAIVSGKALPNVKGVRFRNNKLYCVVSLSRSSEPPNLPTAATAYEMVEPDFAIAGEEPVKFSVMREDGFVGVHVRMADHMYELAGPAVNFLLEDE